MLAARREREISTTFQWEGGREGVRKEGREEGEGGGKNQVSYKGIEVKMGLNFIATLEARRPFLILKENYFYPKIST